MKFETLHVGFDEFDEVDPEFFARDVVGMVAEAFDLFSEDYVDRVEVLDARVLDDHVEVDVVREL